MDPLEIYRIQPGGTDELPGFEVYNRFSNVVVCSAKERAACAGWIIDQHIKYVSRNQPREYSKTA